MDHEEILRRCGVREDLIAAAKIGDHAAVDWPTVLKELGPILAQVLLGLFGASAPAA